jgi:drug/metabolite transporter (DMT)-like permease
VTALIVSLQPLLTGALAGPLLGEQVGRRQWLGLLLGFAGAGLVLFGKLAAPEGDWGGITAAVLGLVGITAGTLYQKRFGGDFDLRTGNAVQYAVTAAVLLVIASRVETMAIDWTLDLLIAFAWLILVLSVGAISLFYILIRRGDAARVASLMYLVPPLTALVAWLVFGETLGPLAILGMGVVAVGVALVNR